MSVFAPPGFIVFRVDLFAPGVYGAFFSRLLRSGLPSDTRVTSWWRNPTRNAEVGGAPTSQHLLGLALDLISNRPDEIVRAVRRSGLIVVPESDHVHVQAWPAGIASRIGLLRSLGLE